MWCVPDHNPGKGKNEEKCFHNVPKGFQGDLIGFLSRQAQSPFPQDSSVAVVGRQLRLGIGLESLPQRTFGTVVRLPLAALANGTRVSGSVPKRG
jgi:hypothetical protein